MSTPANYYQDINTPELALSGLPKRVEAVIMACAHIRQEVNRIRNTALANRVPVSPGLLAVLSHLQVDVAFAAVELAQFSGKPYADIAELLKLINDPNLRGSNEDHN